MGVCLMYNLKEMTVTELKEFMAENRNDDQKFSEALGELLSRNPNRKKYTANQSFEEVRKIIQEKIKESQN